MKKLYSRVLPCPTIHWKSIDLRRWYYVWIDEIKCDWWAVEFELDDLKERYGNNIKFELIPLRETIIC